MERRNGARVKNGVWKGWSRVCSCFRLMKGIDSEMDWLQVARKQSDFNLDGLIAAVAAFHLHFLRSSLLVQIFFFLFFFATAARQRAERKFPQTLTLFPSLCALESQTFLPFISQRCPTLFITGCTTQCCLVKGTKGQFLT